MVGVKTLRGGNCLPILVQRSDWKLEWKSQGGEVVMSLEQRQCGVSMVCRDSYEGQREGQVF